jgi:hypothetical protein
MLISSTFLSLDIARAADDYKRLSPDVSCELRSKGDVYYDADGLMNGDVEFLCEGKMVDLVDGKLIKGWLATKKFGKIMIKQAGPRGIVIFVTDEQKESLKRAFK